MSDFGNVVTTMRDGSTSWDSRLGRLIAFDERSRDYPVQLARRAADMPLHDRTWRLLSSKMGDQGREGACVEFGISHELAALPVQVSTKQLETIRSQHRIYWQAQREDEFPGGSYPGAVPVEEGTSVLAGMKVATALGYYDSYEWAFTDDERVAGVVHKGPAVSGCWYMDGMFNPRPSGLVHTDGNVAGGHCMAWIGVLFGHKLPGEKRMDLAVLAQSWGLTFGVAGRIYVPLDEWLALLKNDGETVFGVGRHPRGKL